MIHARRVQVAVFAEESSELWAESRKTKLLLREIPRSRAMTHDLTHDSPEDLGP